MKTRNSKASVNGHAGNLRHYVKPRPFVALSISLLMIYMAPASAEYSYEVVLPPGATFAQSFGINNAGTVTGGANDGITSFSFTYDIGTGEYTTISTEFFVALDISNPGVIVGDVDDVCAIRDKKGNVTTFFPPSVTADSFCQARGVNSNGKVSGFEILPDGVWLGFIYDSIHGTYEEFLPSGQTIAHAINARGQNVGSVRLDADEGFPGSAEGRYGYLRQSDGAVKFFAISESQGFPGQTRARGISESGLIAGFYFDGESSEFKSYVTRLSSGTEFEEITLGSDDIVHRKPCDPNVPPSPGPEYELFTDMFASQIRNDGVIVGSCSDYYFNETTGDFVSFNYGFVATPVH